MGRGTELYTREVSGWSTQESPHREHGTVRFAHEHGPTSLPVSRRCSSAWSSSPPSSACMSDARVEANSVRAAKEAILQLQQLLLSDETSFKRTFIQHCRKRGREALMELSEITPFLQELHIELPDDALQHFVALLPLRATVPSSAPKIYLGNLSLSLNKFVVMLRSISRSLPADRDPTREEDQLAPSTATVGHNTLHEAAAQPSGSSLRMTDTTEKETVTDDHRGSPEVAARQRPERAPDVPLEPAKSSSPLIQTGMLPPAEPVTVPPEATAIASSELAPAPTVEPAASGRTATTQLLDFIIRDADVRPGTPGGETSGYNSPSRVTPLTMSIGLPPRDSPDSKRQRRKQATLLHAVKPSDPQPPTNSHLWQRTPPDPPVRGHDVITRIREALSRPSIYDKVKIFRIKGCWYANRLTG